MSGGSFNYLYCKDADELFNCISDLVDMADVLLKYDCPDIAKDTRRLIEYIKSAHIRIEVLREQLSPIFRAVEYYESCDIGEDSLRQAIEKYRSGKGEEG